MTTLFLDVPQRVNISIMLDGIEGVGRRENWAICRLQDQLKLTDEEKIAVGWQEIVADGNTYVRWNGPEVSRHKTFEIADDDLARLCRAIDQYRFVRARDKQWYDPLIAQLPEPPKPAEQVQSMAPVNGMAA